MNQVKNNLSLEAATDATSGRPPKTLPKNPPLSTSARAVAGMRKIWPGAVVARGAEPSGAERSGWVKTPLG